MNFGRRYLYIMDTSKRVRIERIRKTKVSSDVLSCCVNLNCVDDWDPSLSITINVATLSSLSPKGHSCITCLQPCNQISDSMYHSHAILSSSPVFVAYAVISQGPYSSGSMIIESCVIFMSPRLASTTGLVSIILMLLSNDAEFRSPSYTVNLML